MKRIIIITMMFLSTYCSLSSCQVETDRSQCTKHTMEAEYNYLSCFKYKDGTDDQCTPYFSDHGTQKIFTKFHRGYQKEYISIYPELGDTIQTYDKETYDRDDTISFTSIPITEEDKRIISNKKNCFYNAYSRFVDSNHYIDKTKINVTDKNVCFNAEKFEDLKDIMDCGFATVKGKYKNVSFTFTNCFMITDEKADGTFKQFYNGSFSKQLFQTYYEQAIKNAITLLDINIEGRPTSKKRQLQTQEIEDFDMVVEDKHGNIVRYNQNGDIIGGDNEPNKFVNSSGKNSLDFILLLCFILLFN